MEDNWSRSIDFTLKMEGGSTAENDPNDPGGLTKYGISKRAYPNLDIENLTLEEAKAIYRRDYWEACWCDKMPADFAVAVFDCAVNQGVGRSIRILQSALNVDADGILGPTTMKALAAAGPRTIKRLLAMRMAEYMRLIRANTALQVFAVNWCFRVLALHELTIEMAQQELKQ